MARLYQAKYSSVKVYYLVVIFLFAACSIAVAIDCNPDPTDMCKCRSSTGNIALDLRTFLSLPFTNIPDNESPGVYEYTFSPCTPMDCSDYDDPSGVMCQYAAGFDAWYIARASNPPTWTIKSENPLEFTVTFTGGDVIDEEGQERSAKVTFKYDGSITDTVISMDNEDSDGTHHFYDFNVKGKDITLGGGGVGGGGGGVAAGVVGLVLMSLFFAAVLAYFVVGIIVNYRYKGARGSEIFPNVDFWKDVPFLIKDGFLFTISPCYQRESYQKF